MSNTPNPDARGRFSSPRKTAAVLRLLRAEDLEPLSREFGITAATLSGWRDDFLAGGQAALKNRPTDERDDEIARLRAKVGELTRDNELLLQLPGRPPCRPEEAEAVGQAVSPSPRQRYAASTSAPSTGISPWGWRSATTMAALL
jgi:hypothetical protein